MDPQAGIRVRGIERRFERAHEHFKDAERAIHAYVDRDPTSLVAEPRGRASEYVIRVVQSESPDLLAWGLMIGDAVHNLRSALDAAVWHLAINQSGSDPPPHPGRVGFPVYQDSELFYKSGVRHIESIDQSAQSAVEQMQPFQKQNAPDYEPLWVLHRLSNVDKHRVIAPVLVESGSLSLPEGIRVSDAEEVRIVYTGEPVVDGAILYRVILDRPSFIEMHLHETFGVGFRAVDLGLPPDLGFLRFSDVMNKMHGEAARAITDLNQFF